MLRSDEIGFSYVADGASRAGAPVNRMFGAETVHAGSGAVVFTRGELDVASAPELLRRLLALLSLPIDSLGLDLAELEFIDSTGIEALDRARMSAGEKGVTFTLSSVPDQARRILAIADMLARFDLRDVPLVPQGFD